LQYLVKAKPGLTWAVTVTAVTVTAWSPGSPGEASDSSSESVGLFSGAKLPSSLAPIPNPAADQMAVEEAPRPKTARRPRWETLPFIGVE